jgi:hypothetical protein
MPYLHLDLPFAVTPAVQCDIRRGRAPEPRARVGEAVAARLEEALGRPPARTVLEFTQHPGDEVWRASGLGSDWSAADAAARG